MLKIIKRMFVGLSRHDHIADAERVREEHARQALYHAHMVMYYGAEIKRLETPLLAAGHD